MQTLASEGSGIHCSVLKVQTKRHPLEKKRAYKKAEIKFSLHTFFFKRKYAPLAFFFKRKYAPLAQLVEQLTLNQWVPGSNP